MEWLGHDYDILSCATDITRHPQGMALVGCEDNLVAIRINDQDNPEIVGYLGKLDGFDVGADTWESQVLDSHKGLVAVALNQQGRISEQDRFQTRLFLAEDGKARRIYENANAHIDSLSIGENWVIAVFQIPFRR